MTILEGMVGINVLHLHWERLRYAAFRRAVHLYVLT